MLLSCNKEVILTEEKLPEEIFYAENSSHPFSGRCVIYYKNSKQVHYLYHFEKGILSGDFKSYYKSGSVEFEGNYYDGELAGDLIRYNEDGTVKLKSTFAKTKVGPYSSSGN
jgi:antitoxin component YwqK of YwqJK toxin-antitoxin module